MLHLNCVLLDVPLASGDELAQEGGRRKEGRKDGRTEGWKDGRTEGRKDGRTDGTTDGRNDGRTEGRKEGREEVVSCTFVTIYGTSPGRRG